MTPGASGVVMSACGRGWRQSPRHRPLPALWCWRSRLRSGARFWRGAARMVQDRGSCMCQGRSDRSGWRRHGL